MQDASYKPKPIDVWAFGVTLYACVFGKLPYWPINRSVYFLAVQNPPEFGKTRHGHDVSKECVEVIKGLLTADPEKRPSISEAINKYSWLRL